MWFHAIGIPLGVDHCLCRDFTFWAKSQGGTLVTCTYIKESTYS